jgi:hypothetical protein
MDIIYLKQNQIVYMSDSHVNNVVEERKKYLFA